MTTHTWLKHKDTGGYFACPNEALEDWARLGWEPSAPPEEPNPVVAERIAWEREQEAAQQETSKSITSAPSGDIAGEMSNG